jgi:hypothetical protein
MTQIFVAGFDEGVDVSGARCINGVALCEDGHVLAGHLSSSLDFCKLDMGVTSDHKHAHYQEHCPDGFELIWVDDPHTHAGWQEALQKNRQLPDADETT